MWIRALILIAVCCQASAEIIPSHRRTTWNPGVTGGIPTVTTIYTNLPLCTLAAINAAIQNCPSNQVVFLTNKFYGFFNGILQLKSGVVLRGTQGQTMLGFGAQAGAVSIMIGSETINRVAPPAGQIKNWTAGYAQGATVITLDDMTDVPGEGHLLVLDQENNNDWIKTTGLQEGCTYCGRETGERAQAQYVRIVSKAGNNVTITPGLHMPNWSATYDPEVFFWTEPDIQMAGVESMTITNDISLVTEVDNPLALHHIYISQAQNCWVKNVEFQAINQTAIETSQAKNISVRRCLLLSGVDDEAQSYGMVFFMCSDSEFVDNICHRVTGSMNYGPQAQGNVVAYNYITNNVYVNPNWDIAGLASHDGHVCMNLSEGNWVNKMFYDSIHGSASHNTDFRNYYHGHQPGKTLNAMAYAAQQFCLTNNIVGNLLGSSDWHDVYIVDSLAEYQAATEEIFQWGAADAGAGSPWDDRVAPSMLNHGNYDTVNDTIIWDAGISDHDIPNSLYLASKPAFFGALEWPPFSSDDPTDNYGTNIPAGHRWLLGTEVPEDGGGPSFGAKVKASGIKVSGPYKLKVDQ